MPRKPSSLRDPRVVMVVVVLLLVVAAVNLQTFLPLHRLGAGSAAGQIEPFTPPSDAAELTRLAAAHVSGAAVVVGLPPVEAPSPEAPNPELPSPDLQVREPSARGSRAATTSPPPATARETTSDSSLPACTAILGTSARPVALIGDVRRQIGDAVGDWVVTGISLEGATLQGPAGTVFLPVGTHANAGARFSLVTKAEAAFGAGNTALQPVTGSRKP